VGLADRLVIGCVAPSVAPREVEAPEAMEAGPLTHQQPRVVRIPEARRRAVPRPLRPRGREPEPPRERILELVLASQQNDREAFGHLYRIYYRRIYNLARFYLPQQAEDVVAETFVRAWAAIVRYKDTGRPFVAWLYGIARHVVADELKGQRRVEPREELPDSPTESPEDDRIMLAMGLARLPTEQRRVLELKYLLGLSHGEIAAALRKSVGAVKALRWRGLQKLAAILTTR
jgi:RNA polymerase sigma-70 factor (ECF subfamily)